jgi:hypothetical protein
MLNRPKADIHTRIKVPLSMGRDNKPATRINPGNHTRTRALTSTARVSIRHLHTSRRSRQVAQLMQRNETLPSISTKAEL